MLRTSKTKYRTTFADTLVDRRGSVAREYSQICARLAITVCRLRGAYTRAAAAAELGIDERTLRRYEHGGMMKMAKAVQLLWQMECVIEAAEYERWKAVFPDMSRSELRQIRIEMLTTVQLEAWMLMVEDYVTACEYRDHDTARKRAERVGRRKSGHNLGTLAG